MTLVAKADLPHLAYAAVTLSLRLLPTQTRFRWRSPLARLLGTLWYHLDRSSAAIARRNMQAILGERLPAGEVDGRVRLHFQNSALNRIINDMLPDLTLAQLGRFLQLEGSQHIEAALAEGRGAILLGAHLCQHGYIPMMLMKRMGYRFTAIVGQEVGEDYSDTWIYRHLVHPVRRRVDREFQSPPAKLVYIDGLPRREVVECLQRNELLLVWGDLVNGELLRMRPPYAVPVTLLGRRVPLRTGFFRLARWLNAPVLPFFIVPGERNFVMKVEPPIPLSQDRTVQGLVDDLTVFAGRLEEHLLAYPERWIYWRARPLLEIMRPEAA